MSSLGSLKPKIKKLSWWKCDISFICKLLCRDCKGGPGILDSNFNLCKILYSFQISNHSSSLRWRNSGFKIEIHWILDSDFGLHSPITGLLASGNFFLENRRRSGNFNIFAGSPGKSGKNDLAEMNQSLSLISRHISVNTYPMLAGSNFSLVSLGILCNTRQICAVSSGKVRKFKWRWPWWRLGTLYYQS